MIKRYDEYKDSNIQWFGEIPKHWNTSSLKHLLAKIFTGGTPTTTNTNYWADFDEEGIPWVAISDITKSNGKLYKTQKEITEEGKDFKGLEIIPKGTLLLSIFASLGKITELETEATINQAILGLLPGKKLDKDYLKYFLKDAERYIGYYSSMSTQENLNLSKIRNLIFTVPTIVEQTKIAEYLNHQTGLIDNIIEKKQQLIEKLKEQRQAIINEAVTKGLNPDAPTKDSGVEWMGDIPEHWDLVKLKYLKEKIGSGVTPRGGGEVYVDQGVLFLRSQNVHFSGLSLKDVKRIDEETHRKMGNSKVEKDDVLLNITGASIGRCCIVELDEEINVNQHVCIIRTNVKLSPQYLNLVLQSSVGQTQVELLATGGNREGLTFEAIKNFDIPLPVIAEQLKLASIIQQKTENFEKVIKESVKQIELLNKYRQSIISEAVTGKIDVREWEPKTIEIV